MKPNFRKFYVLVILFWLPAIGGCCRPVESTPPRPAHVRGWQKFQEQNINAIGEFVLQTGESVDNRTVGIELVKIAPGKSCRGTESTDPIAEVRFFRLSDKQTILQLKLIGRTTRLISFDRSLVEEYGIDTISIRAINTKEGWIWFELWE